MNDKHEEKAPTLTDTDLDKITGGAQEGSSPTSAKTLG